MVLSLYQDACIPLLVVTLVLSWFSRPQVLLDDVPEGFRSCQDCFLLVWVLCAGVSGLQGPYVFALYENLGYDPSDISELYVASFVSAMVCGSTAGLIADRFGRRRMCLAYCLICGVGCLTKHVNHFWVLMLGRIFDGVATAILKSCFECWLISEYTVRHKFSSALLSVTFGLMASTYYLMAVLAGVIGAGVDHAPLRPIAPDSIVYVGGDTTPFDLAIFLLIIGFAVISFTWKENYGKTTHAHDLVVDGRYLSVHTIGDSVRAIFHDRRVALVGLVVTCFEGTMFSFVYHWTPALHSTTDPPPHGLVFAELMAACMCGAAVATILREYTTPLQRLGFVFIVGSLSFGIAACVAGDETLVGYCLGCLLIFEFCVGVYFPSVGQLKSAIVPEQMRSTVYALYLIPVNIVVVSLVYTNISVRYAFQLCAALLSLGALCVAVIAYGGFALDTSRDCLELSVDDQNQMAQDYFMEPLWQLCKEPSHLLEGELLGDKEKRTVQDCIVEA